MKKHLIVVLICIMAASMSGCGLLSSIVGNAEGKESTQMELPEVTTRPREEIESTGITAADVLGRLDEIMQIRTEFFYGKAEASIVDRVNTQFVSITPSSLEGLEGTSGYGLSQSFDFYFVKNFLENHEEYTKEYFGAEFAPHHTIGNVYVVNIQYWEELDGYAAKEELRDWGIAQREFEAVLEAFGSTASETLTIDRELIEGATDEQLWCLYDMAETIYMINMEGRLPEDTPNIIVNEDGEVREYSCYMVPIRFATYWEDGVTVAEEKLFTYDKKGNLTEFDNTVAYEADEVWRYVTKQKFDENGCIVENTNYQYENGVLTHKTVVTYAPEQQVDKYLTQTIDIFSGWKFSKEMIYNGEDVLMEYAIPEYDEYGGLTKINYYSPDGEFNGYWMQGQYYYPDGSGM